MASLLQWEKKYYPNNTCNLYIMYTILSPKYVNYKKGINISSAYNVCIFQPRYCIIYKYTLSAERETIHKTHEHMLT